MKKATKKQLKTIDKLDRAIFGRTFKPPEGWDREQAQINIDVLNNMRGH